MSICAIRYAKNIDAYTDFFEKRIFLSNKEKQLLRLYTAGNPSPEDVSSLFALVDYERESYSFNYMLSRFCARHGYAGAPNDLIPRIRGFHRHVAVDNARKLCTLVQLGKTYNEQSIPILVAKGGALRLGVLSDIPRQMGDVDIIVRREHFDAAKRIALEVGFTTEYDALHSLDLLWHGEHCLDLHYAYFKTSVWLDCEEGVWKRAKCLNRSGCELLIPSTEDLFLHLLINAFENIVVSDSHKGGISWAADCFDLLSANPGLSFDGVVRLAYESGLTPQFRVISSILCRMIPGVFNGLLQDGRLTRSDRRILSRLIKCSLYSSVPSEEILSYPLLRHVFFRLNYTYYCNAFYMPDKSVISCLCKYPAFLKVYWSIGSFSELPAKLRKKLSDRR